MTDNHTDDRVTIRENNPTEDGQEFLGDTSGQTGVTTNSQHKRDRSLDNDLTATMSSERFDDSLATAQGQDGNDQREEPANNDFSHVANASDNESHSEDESSVSGTTPTPDADDDTLTNSHDMGLRLDEDEDHPKELNVGADVDKAEEYQLTH